MIGGLTGMVEPPDGDPAVIEHRPERMGEPDCAGRIAVKAQCIDVKPEPGAIAGRNGVFVHE